MLQSDSHADYAGGSYNNSHGINSGYDGGHGMGSANGSGQQAQYHGMDENDGHDGHDENYGPIGIKEDG